MRAETLRRRLAAGWHSDGGDGPGVPGLDHADRWRLPDADPAAERTHANGYGWARKHVERTPEGGFRLVMTSFGVRLDRSLSPSCPSGPLAMLRAMRWQAERRVMILEAVESNLRARQEREARRVLPGVLADLTIERERLRLVLLECDAARDRVRNRRPERRAANAEKARRRWAETVVTETDAEREVRLAKQRERGRRYRARRRQSRSAVTPLAATH